MTGIWHRSMRSTPTPQNGSAPRDKGALSLFQQRLWVLERLHPRNPVHNVSCGVRLKGLLDGKNFAHAWREVISRYAILRTEFHAVHSAPQPVFLASPLAPLRTVDLEAIPTDQRETKLFQLAREEVRRSFNVSNGPLLRASLWRLAPLESVLLLVAHRIVCDEPSLELLLGE